jgi:hypothetical protein
VQAVLAVVFEVREQVVHPGFYLFFLGKQIRRWLLAPLADEE